MTEHVAVVDLGYGDAGKGTVVDALCAASRKRAVLRFNGGAQAAHNVVAPDGRHHTFAQFGSGTFAGVPTHLTRFVVVDPLALAAEAAALGGSSGPTVNSQVNAPFCGRSPAAVSGSAGDGRAKNNAAKKTNRT